MKPIRHGAPPGTMQNTPSTLSLGQDPTISNKKANCGPHHPGLRGVRPPIDNHVFMVDELFTSPN
jgi:hypothetical protein